MPVRDMVVSEWCQWSSYQRSTTASPALYSPGVFKHPPLDALGRTAIRRISTVEARDAETHRGIVARPIMPQHSPVSSVTERSLAPLLVSSSVGHRSYAEVRRR